MRAMRLGQPEPVSAGPLALQELPDAEPGADEVALEVAACAVCRTDLQLTSGTFLHMIADHSRSSSGGNCGGGGRQRPKGAWAPRWGSAGSGFLRALQMVPGRSTEPV